MALSRTVAHALRHEPWIYELELDAEGWVGTEELLSALRSMKPDWRALAEPDFEEMIARSEKKRYEIREGRIRALYGHSLPGRLQKEPGMPPEVLYHGTAPRTAEVVLKEGLKPMSRQYVHLSVDQHTALAVGRRKSSSPVVLCVQAGTAHDDGIVFYRGNDHVWLADAVPPQFIQTT